MKIKILVSLFLLASTCALASGTYEWEDNRSRYKLTAEEESLSELILKNHLQYDYVLENNQFLMYATVHKISLVNNNEAVQKHNRIFISMYNTVELVDVKARAISKSGRVVLFDKNNLKEIKDEESGSAYRIFAIEGIELGSEVEFYYVKKVHADIFQRIFLQSEVPIKKSSLTVSCPTHLKFEFKSYFGFPDVVTEETEEKYLYTTSMENIPALKKEAFSFHDANLKRVEFKLAYNTARSKERLYTWDDAAKKFYERLNTLEKEESKAISKFVKTLADNPSGDAIERIRNVEEKIKSSVKLSKERAEGTDEINSILKYKLASKEGLTKLFLAVYGSLGIDCQAVITCSREKVKFDKSFDSWSFLDDYFLYFPQTKGWVAPYVMQTRYPFVPPDFTAQSALFIEPIELGGITSGLASLKEIPAMDYTANVDNLNIEVKFNEDFSASQVRSIREFSGYYASVLLPYYNLMTEEHRKNLAEQMTKEIAPDAEIKNFTVKPVDAAKFMVDVDFMSNHFLEKAGPRLLFKVGVLIGPQVEMYREEQRVTGIENEYNRGYDRLIRIHVPASYTIKNLKDLNFDIVYKDREKDPYLFQSSYVLNGSVLEIRIKEYYKEIFAPVDRYEDYRRVINAAADFNKVTLVFEKTK